MIILVCSGLNFTSAILSPVLASKFFTSTVFSSFLLQLSHLLTKGGEQCWNMLIWNTIIQIMVF